MPREKSTRKLNFKPIVKSFIPEHDEPTGVSILLHEEIEAIYLMDVLDLYQEEAAKSMEVSRPTFTRILKSARKKLSIALVSGHKIKFEDSSDSLVVAICSTQENSFQKIDPLQEYIMIYTIKDKKISLLESIINPVYKDKVKPAIVLPKLFLQHKVNAYVSSKIGEGLKNSLISKGIQPIMIDELKSPQELLEIF